MQVLGVICPPSVAALCNPVFYFTCILWCVSAFVEARKRPELYKLLAQLVVVCVILNYEYVPRDAFYKLQIKDRVQENG